MKVKEILNIENEEFAKKMTEEEYERMRKLGFEYTWQLLDMMRDGVRQSEMGEDEEYTTIDEYLTWLEEIEEDVEEGE